MTDNLALQSASLSSLQWRPSVLSSFLARFWDVAGLGDVSTHIDIARLISDCIHFTSLSGEATAFTSKTFFCGFLYAVSNTYAGMLPPRYVIMDGAKLVVTLSFQPTPKFDAANANIQITALTRQYRLSWCYQWVVTFILDGMEHTEKFYTINIGMGYRKYGTINYESVTRLKYIWYALNLVYYAISYNNFKEIELSGYTASASLLDKLNHTDTQGIQKCYYVLRKLSPANAVSFEAYRNWIYVRSILHKMPCLLFTEAATDKSLFNALAFFFDSPMSDLGTAYLVHKTALVDRVKQALLSALAIVKSPSFVDSKENSLEMYLPNEFGFKDAIILPLFVKLDATFVDWTRTTDTPMNALSVLYRAFIKSIWDIPNGQTVLEILVSRVTSTFIEEYLTKLSAGLSILGTPLVQWLNLILLYDDRV